MDLMVVHRKKGGGYPPVLHARGLAVNNHHFTLPFHVQGFPLPGDVWHDIE